MRPANVLFLSISLSLCLLPEITAASDSPLFGPRNPAAPAGVEQFGQFVGTWSCVPTVRQEDGSHRETDARPTWVWHYALNGMAVQDVWVPDPERSPPGSVLGTNLRVYDPEADQWEMVWTTESMAGFQHFTARMRDRDIVMRGDISAGIYPAHLARITFHKISDDHFDWKYEASAPGDGENWQLHSMLSCDRTDPY